VHIRGIWRYPVKAMGGEPVDSCEITAAGLVGDRLVQVVGSEGKVLTVRDCPKLLLHTATLGEDGQPLVDESPWQEARAAEIVAAAAGSGARLVAAGPDGRADRVPLLVLTNGAIDVLGYDARRYRANLIIGGVKGTAERSWVGKRLKLGDAAVIRVVGLRKGCGVAVYDPDTAEADPEVVARIEREMEGAFGLDCEVVEPGRIQCTEEVELGG